MTCLLLGLRPIPYLFGIVSLSLNGEGKEKERGIIASVAEIWITK